MMESNLDILVKPNVESAHEEYLEKSLTVDTVHNDQGLEVIAHYDGEKAWDPEEEKKLVHRIDLRLLPILCVTYGIQYYDKSTISQAAIFGLTKDLHLTGNRYSMSASIFYIGFIAGVAPIMLLAQRYPLQYIAAGTVGVWGVTLMATAGCTTFQGLYTQRFFLGFLEAGISPMFMLIVGSWYKKNEQALRMGAWLSCTGYVALFAPLINYGLGHITGTALHSWQYMFLVAGGMTVLWSLVILFLLPAEPTHAKCLDERQKYIAVSRLQTNNTGVRNVHFKPAQIVECLLDIKFWLIFFFSFFTQIANGPVSTFSPIIIHGFGYSTLNTLLLNMPPGFILGTVDLIACYVACRVPGVRTYIILVCHSISVAGALMLWLLPLHAKGALVVATCLLPVYGGSIAIAVGLQIANTAGYTKRTVSSAGIYIGYCLGNITGPLFFKPQDAPRYQPAFITVTITTIAAALTALAYRLTCIYQNKQRDRAGTMEAFDHAFEDDVTDRKNPQFRYIY
ncbi:uncharacterized protein Z518_01767 [Rhinocladiella mackenziei CBS 650.93]|uniref:Major facilitator superfamily (MFS) profile domain-containing protein n=1 Tax=Rhinocladiella mackenziei CBS 650.93 TaxID=1442369 RepID=A0A0D2HJ40_9EURO|nr:uncharacterized protein Z518_01767 [Rhinocladiella mackenziei CBS 650.93]KIX10683.1 hypothetical protein Z518_01767 [Rhinocladiella mackenziei CBS 650.93]